MFIPLLIGCGTSEMTSDNLDQNGSRFSWFRSGSGVFQDEDYGRVEASPESIKVDGIISSLLNHSDCSGNEKERIHSALRYLITLKSNETPSSLFQEIFSERFDGRLVLQWVFARVHYFKCFSRQGTRTNYPLRFNDDNGHMIFLFIPPEAEHSDVRLLSRIIQQARHIESHRYNHISTRTSLDDGLPLAVTCQALHGGRDLCDDSEKDSYGVATVFNANVAQLCEDCSQQQKSLHARVSLESIAFIMDAAARDRLADDLSLKSLLETFNLSKDEIQPRY